MNRKTRKYESGCEKRKKKKRIEDEKRSQKGAIDKFVVRGVVGNCDGLNENQDDIDNVNGRTAFDGDINNEKSLPFDKPDNDFEDVSIENVGDSPCENVEEEVNDTDNVTLDNNDDVNFKDDILNHMKKVGGCFPNAVTAYRILLTTPVTVASAERSFSKLELLKSYLRSTMSQDRLNGLAMITIENKVLDRFCYEDLIDDFASANARRANLFKK